MGTLDDPSRGTRSLEWEQAPLRQTTAARLQRVTTEHYAPRADTARQSPGPSSLAEALSRLYQSSTGYCAVLTTHDAAYLAPYVSLIEAFRAPGGRVADVGCGIGVAVSLLAERGPAIGIDLSPYFLGAGRSNGVDPSSPRGATYVAADTCLLPFRNSSFDVVASQDVLEHVTDVEAALNEMMRVVTGGGYLIMWCPNLLSPFRPLQYVAGMLRGGRPTPVWAESVGHGLRMVFHNGIAIMLKLLSRTVGFTYRYPDLATLAGATGHDEDAVYLANPVDLRRFLTQRGWLVLSPTRLKVRESRVRALLRRLMPDLVSPVVLVVRRPDH